MRRHIFHIKCIVFGSLYFISILGSGATLTINLDLTQAEQHFAKISVRATGIKDYSSLYNGDKKNEFSISGMRIENADGPISFKKQDQYFQLDHRYQGELNYSYQVSPGKLGRHGRQGYINDNFASFDGRAFIVPNNSRHIDEIHIVYHLPKGWRAINAFEKKHGTTLIKSNKNLAAITQLRKSALAFGNFNAYKRQFGDTVVTINIPASWNKVYRKRLRDKSFRLYQYFYQHYAFSPVPRYHITWTPASADNIRVFGGSWSNGVQFEMPEQNLRNWELLAHRIAHALNKYRPSAFDTIDSEDSWFNEGWASYIEIIATAQTGLANTQSRWNRLYQRYLRTLESHPEWDLPLQLEAKADANAVEYLHYTKAPIVVKMLEVYLQQNHNCSLEKFMRFIYEKYGHFKSSFSLRGELERFCQASLDPFWEHMIRQTSYLVPIWTEYTELKTTPEDFPIIIDAWKVSKAYIRYLSQREDINSYTQLIETLSDHHNIRFTKNDGVSIIPAYIVRDLNSLPPKIQFLAYRLKQSWNAPGKNKHNFRLNSASNSAGKLAGLLRQEEKYFAQLMKNDIKSVFLTVNDKKALTFSSRDNLRIVTLWLETGMNVQYQLVSPGGRVFETHSQFIQPHWSHSYINFSKPRPNREGIWKIRILANGKELITRSFWQLN